MAKRDIVKRIDNETTTTLNWMVPGRLYLVEHVEFAFEVDR
jgi:hypothetical protein